MIRIFNHYMGRANLLRAAMDAAIVMVAVFGAVLLQASPVGNALPVAASGSLTIAAALFFINSATGFYEAKSSRSFGATMLRAIGSLGIALPLTYFILKWLQPGSVTTRSHKSLRWRASQRFSCTEVTKWLRAPRRHACVRAR